MIKQKQDFCSSMRVSTVVILVFLSLLLSSPISIKAQVEEQPVDSYAAYLLDILDATTITPVENLEDFAVTLSESRAGYASEYKLDFQLRQSTYDLLKNGGFKLAFPVGFALGSIESMVITDNCQAFKLGVGSWVVADQLITIYLQPIRCDECEESLTLDATVADTTLIDISLIINAIINHPVAGDYQIAGVAFKQNGAVIAGPTFSQVFTITANTVSSIVVSPSEDITVKAGESVTFTASAFDDLDNEVEGVSFLWGLDCGDCLGYFEGSTLHVTTPGEARAVASVNGVSGQSGLITARPGNLARMELFISASQVVKQPLLGQAYLVLYDGFGNLKTDYSLSGNPIYLRTTGSQLVPDVIDDDALLVNGSIDLIPVGITYQGMSATTAIYADDNTVMSNSVNVSFNGYDVSDVLDAQGNTISAVYAGQPTTVSVEVLSDGNIVAESPATLRARFTSISEITETTFVPGELGQIVVVPLGLPVIQHDMNADELVVELTARFNIDGEIYETVNIRSYPIDVIHPATFEFVEGSFKPDTILAGSSFTAQFAVFSDGFDRPIDSTNVAIHVVSAPGGDILATLYEGSPEYAGFDGGTISYDGLESLLDAALSLSTGWYTLRVDYVLYSLGAIFTIDNANPDSIYVIGDVDLVVDPGLVTPSAVAAGAPAQFSFVVNSGSVFPLMVDLEQSSFTVTGAGFSTSTSLNVEGGEILPGDNLFTSGQIFVPLTEEGNQLSLEANISFKVPGIAEAVVYNTDFSGLLIEVTSLPVIQIINLEAVAPNVPNVNTLQQFELVGKVANLSSAPVMAAELRLTSDGYSTFEPATMMVDIPANDTIDVSWDVVAASEPNTAEIIIMELDHTGVTHLSPVDNVALITIQTPAALDLTYSLFGVENSLADYGSEISLTVELVNYGMAATSDGSYRMTVEGLDLDGTDTYVGSISADRHIEFSFTAPQKDTIIEVYFELTVLPDDLNTLQTAAIEDVSFQIFIGVVSGDAELFVEIIPIGTNLVLPGRPKDLFEVNLTNTGISEVTTLMLEKISIVLLNGFGYPLDAISTINIGNTGFYEDDQKITGLTAGDSVLIFNFQNFILEPRDSRQLVFKAELKETLESAVAFHLSKSGVEARFLEGPNAGLLVPVTSDSEGEDISPPILSVKGSSLSGSFTVETNPFNPEDPSQSPVRFSYELPAAADVEFRIFTLTGEEVYSSEYSAGSSGGIQGENLIEWDGRNDDGQVVRNGVYVAQMKNVSSGEIAYLKIAVVK
ncbi:MAG: FlgD immunoglobulin-like domain containing protein [Candidatus Zixiibacteriota bacterium]